MTISFIIISVFMLVAMIYILSGDIHLLHVVRAGSVSKNVLGIKVVDFPERKTVSTGNGIEDISGLEAMYVKGNSMRDYNIFDGSTVFVQKITGEDRNHITTHPVLVLMLKKKNPLVSQLKLRKFICYIPNIEDVDWQHVFNEQQDRIKLTYPDFISVIENKIVEMKERNEYFTDTCYILSETYEEDKNKYSYSLHRSSSVCGKVKFSA